MIGEAASSIPICLRRELTGNNKRRLSVELWYDPFEHTPHAQGFRWRGPSQDPCPHTICVHGVPLKVLRRHMSFCKGPHLSTPLARVGLCWNGVVKQALETGPMQCRSQCTTARKGSAGKISSYAQHIGGFTLQLNKPSCWGTRAPMTHPLMAVTTVTAMATTTRRR